jgi:hypothetical protein
MKNRFEMSWGGYIYIYAIPNERHDPLWPAVLIFCEIARFSGQLWRNMNSYIDIGNETFDDCLLLSL